MNTGMMWFDNDSKTPLAEKVRKAADYYHTKYGGHPDLCLVNPLAYDQAVPEVLDGQSGAIHVRPLRSILPGHLWIGVDEKLPTGAD